MRFAFAPPAGVGISDVSRRKFAEWASILNETVARPADRTRYLSEWRTLDAAITAIGESEVRLVLLAGTSMALTANASIPDNITLDPRMGVIELNGFDLTIGKMESAGGWLVFDDSDGGTVTFDEGAVDTAKPEWWLRDAGDATSAFRSAIASIAATGGVVECGSRTYTANNNGTPLTAYESVIDVPENVTIRGTGNGSIVKVTANLGSFASGTAFIRLSGDFAGAENVRLIGNYGGAGVQPATGLSIEGASYCRVENVKSSGFQVQPFSIRSTAADHPTRTPGIGSNYNCVSDCLFEGGTGTVVAIYSTPTAGVKNIGNKFVNVKARADASFVTQFFSLEIRFSDQNQFVNCDFTDSNLANRGGINIEQSASDNTFTNCRISGNYSGLYTFGISGRVKRNRFIACDFVGNVASGALLQNADDTHFIGGNISRNGSRGINESPLTTATTMAIEFSAGYDTDWVAGQTATSSGGGSATILAYYDGVLYLTDHSDLAGFAAGNTVTQDTNTATISALSSDPSTGTDVLDVDIAFNASYGMVLGAGRTRVLLARFKGNVDRSISLSADTTGVIDHCDFDTDFQSSLTQCGDIYVSTWLTSKMKIGENNRYRISRVYNRRATTPINYVSAANAPLRSDSTVLSATLQEDSGSMAPERLVRVLNATNATALDIPLSPLVGYPATNILIYARLKDDGTARDMGLVYGATTVTVTTDGSGTWGWYTFTLPVAGISGSTAYASVRKTATSGTVYSDGYVLKDG